MNDFVRFAEDEFLGKPIRYWLELDRRVREANMEEIALENADLRGACIVLLGELDRLQRLAVGVRKKLGLEP